MRRVGKQLGKRLGTAWDRIRRSLRPGAEKKVEERSPVPLRPLFQVREVDGATHLLPYHDLSGRSRNLARISGYWVL